MTAPLPGISATPATQCRNFIIGTAGHIDHGKTSLVLALTGVNTDRLPEEKRRGMTIELGFASLTVGDFSFGIVDVPGHERFVKTMVAGATGIDIALLIVAADDSVMPQTVEHLEILRLLGVRHMVVAITKMDVVDEEMLDLVKAEVQEFLEPTPFKNAQLCAVSSITGAGIDAMKLVLAEEAMKISRADLPAPFRMSVDRLFTVQGRGTVITGSVLRGSVSKGDTLEVHPAGVEARVRDLQTHGAASEGLHKGQRAAINLAGIEKENLERGSEVATPGYLSPSPMVDVHLSVLRSYGRPLKSPSHARLQIGTGDLPVRVVLHSVSSVETGDSAYAQLRSGEPILSTFGQHFILRDENGAHTIGGGIILRPFARRRRRGNVDDAASLQRLHHGEPCDRLDEVLRRAGFSKPAPLQICARTGIELHAFPAAMQELANRGLLVPINGTEAPVSAAALSDLSTRLTQWLERQHQAHPELPGRPMDSVLGWLERMSGSKPLARPLYDFMLRQKKIKALGRFVCAPAFAPALSASDEKFLAAMLQEFERGGFQPPALSELTFARVVDRKRLERLATLAVAFGELKPIDQSIFLHTACERQMRELVADLIGKHGGVTVAQIREALNSSRKYVVPFVEYLDRIGFTRRNGDLRILA